ncbi:hypothetical protein HYC85_013856 [Camellia sinensis]|uniref:Uncharacterized protein n=1 Tax=Camellia sinensis TaxID=4442 RepID=A0A7J7H4K7_CAMSI|nr:hypothetical protein HYC85_013856 [Camellia sinensis]
MALTPVDPIASTKFHAAISARKLLLTCISLQYVLAVSENIKKTAHWEVDVQVDFFHANSGANRLVGGLFKGRTLVYSDLNHIVLRISPKYASEAEESAILISSHIDTDFSTLILCSTPPPGFVVSCIGNIRFAKYY